MSSDLDLSPSAGDSLDGLAQQRDEVLGYFRMNIEPRDKARHWQAVVAAHRGLALRSGESPSLDIRATALDYFLKRGMLVDPVVVENDSLTAAYEMAHRDRLTGLSNYAYFDDESRLEVARALRYDHPVALVLLDLDGLKGVNDHEGHGAGNDVLVDVARVLQDGSRTGDVIARVGGDEFALLLHCADATTGLRVAVRKREAIERRFRDRPSSNGALPVTASLGVAAVPEHANHVRELFDAADRALYHAKKLGGNRVAFSRRGRLTCLGSFAERHLGVDRDVRFSGTGGVVSARAAIDVQLES